MPEITSDCSSSKTLHAPSNQYDVAELITRYLESIGIKYTFGIPGGAIEPILNALAKSTRREGITHINSCHETAAAYMADGYYRETGQLGVCIATSGPGATNLLTGVSCAYNNNIPMLILTGQPAIPSFGKNALQESSDAGVNIMGMFEHCTHYNSLISHPDQLPNKLASALLTAIEAKGPVHLSFPVDILRQSLSVQQPMFDLAHKLHHRSKSFDHGQADELVRQLQKRPKPVFFIGSGAGEAIESIMRLAKKTNALFVTTPDAKGLINPLHGAYRGVFGFGGHESATNCIQANTGITVAFGTSFDELSSNAWSKDLLNESLIHVDEITNNFLDSPMAMLHVHGHIATVCQHVIDHLAGSSTSSTKKNAVIEGHFNPYIQFEKLEKYYSDDTPIKPQRLMKELSECFPSSTRFLADAGNSMLWAPHYLQPKNRRGSGFEHPPPYKSERRSKTNNWLRLTLKFAPMGWAIGASIGVSISRPDYTTVCIAGDGAYLMCGQEITTAIRKKLSVIFVILNDSAYGMVMHGQRLAKAERTSFELQTVDFAKQAESLGIPGFVIRSPKDFDNIDFKQLCAQKSPAILDVRIDREEVPPMKTRLKALGTLQEK